MRNCGTTQNLSDASLTADLPLPPTWRKVRLGSVTDMVRRPVGEKASKYELLSLTLRGVIPRDLENRMGKMPANFETYQVVHPGELVFCLFDVEETPRTVGLSTREGIVTGAYSVLKPRRDIDARFLHYHYLHYDSRKSLSYLYAGLRNTIRAQDFKNIQLALPPIELQRALADYLDHETAEIDALISELSASSDLLQERSLATIDSTFLRRATQWAPLKRFGTVKTSGYSANASVQPAGAGEVGVLKTGAVSQGFFNPLENKLVDEAREVAKLKVAAMAGTLIVNRANTPSLVGRTAYVDNDYPNLFLSDLLWSLTFKNLNPEFVYFYSKSKKYREAVEVISVGASSTMKKVRFEDFARLEVPVLSAQEQESIVAEMRRSEDVLQSTQQDIKKTLDLARERRAALISAAVTGQIDVTQRRKPVAEQLEEEVLNNA